MIDIFTMIAVLVAGFLLGGFFFGGLLWTVKRGLTAKFPAFWFFVSFVVRIGVVVGGFYLISAGQWERILVCFAGFLIMRFVIIRLTHTTKKISGSTKGAGNAT